MLLESSLFCINFFLLILFDELVSTLDISHRDFELYVLEMQIAKSEAIIGIREIRGSHPRRVESFVHPWKFLESLPRSKLPCPHSCSRAICPTLVGLCFR